MKTVIKSVLLGLSMFAAFCALLVASASSVQARPITKEKKEITSISHAAFATASGRAINVNIEKPAGETLLVSFVNQKGQVLADKVVSKSSGAYSVKFNVEQLPDGVYHVKIMGKENVGEYTFTLATPETQVVARTLTVQ